MLKKRNLIFLSLLILGVFLITGCWLISTPTYTVTFDSQGGSAVSSQNVNHGGKATAPTDSTKTGYTFGGWYKESGCTNAWDFANDKVTSNVTLYAQWTINTYTVTFDKNGGDTEADPTTKTATHGGNVGTLPTAPTRTGYTFVSWNTEVGGGGTEFTETTVVTADITVYAQWTINSYTLTMSNTGSGTGTTTPTTGNHTYDYGTSVTISASPASSSTFTGWSGAATGTSDVTLTMTEDKSVTATFTLKSYTITAAAGSNGAIAPVGAVSVDYGANQTFTFTPAANHHIADVKVDGGSVGTAASYEFTNVTADHTIAASFVINSYTVTFNENDDDATGTMSDQTIASGSSANLKANTFTKTGWTFDGWATSSTGIVAYIDKASYTMGASNVTLYAKWTAVINIAAIPGVTAPVKNATPVATITPTDQYTGTVTWSPTHSLFWRELLHRRRSSSNKCC